MSDVLCVCVSIHTYKNKPHEVKISNEEYMYAYYCCMHTYCAQACLCMKIAQAHLSSLIFIHVFILVYLDVYKNCKLSTSTYLHSGIMLLTTKDTNSSVEFLAVKLKPMYILSNASLSKDSLTSMVVKLVYRL